MAYPNALVYDFVADLNAFGDEVTNGATLVFHETAQTTAEAVVLGNQYGPGVPVDTGWARSSFVASVNVPGVGRGDRPFVSRRVTPEGVAVFPTNLDTSPIASSVLGDVVFVTTVAEYPQYLEFTPKRRRYGLNAGASTEFLDPVAARFDAIVDDSARRVGYGGR